MSLSASTYGTNETRRLEDRQELTAGTVSGVGFSGVRVHLYERSFPEEPDTGDGSRSE
jgi:hypothetical protein